MVFLHGVGAGLLPYIHVLLRLTALGQPIMAVEYKHLSMRWTDFIPTAPQVRAVRALLPPTCMSAHHRIWKQRLCFHTRCRLSNVLVLPFFGVLNRSRPT